MAIISKNERKKRLLTKIMIKKNFEIFLKIDPIRGRKIKSYGFYFLAAA